MALPVTIPNEFANATSSIPLSQLDSNFNTLANAVNGINSGSETLANLVATTANVTTGNIVTVNSTTVDTTNIEVTNIKAKDGTASITIADSTGVVTFSNAIVTTTGTSAAPSMTTTGDLNTGIFFPASDTVAIATGGVESARIVSGLLSIPANSTAASAVRLYEDTDNGTNYVDIIAPASLTADRTLTLPDNTGTIITTGSTFAGTGPAFRVYLSGNQTVTNQVNTKVQLNTEVFDTANCFDSTTNYRFTPNVAGYYQFNVTQGGAATSSLSYNFIQIWKNGASDSITVYGPYNTPNSYGALSTLIYMNGTTDYVELYAQLSGTGTLNVVGGATSASTYMSGCLVRAA